MQKYANIYDMTLFLRCAYPHFTYHLLIFSRYTTLAGLVIIISTRLDTNLWYFSCLNLLSSEITAMSCESIVSALIQITAGQYLAQRGYIQTILLQYR